MKFTQKKIQQIIKEELNKLLKENPGLAQALMGKAGLAKKTSRIGSPDPEQLHSRVDSGHEPPTFDNLIQAAELLKMTPSTEEDNTVLYNVGMLLRKNPDASPEDIVKAVLDGREEHKHLGIDTPLQEDKK